MVHVARRIHTWEFRYNAVYDLRSGQTLADRRERETERVEGRFRSGYRSEWRVGAVKLFEHCYYCVWRRPEIQRILLSQLVLSFTAAARRSDPGPLSYINKGRRNPSLNSTRQILPGCGCERLPHAFHHSLEWRSDRGRQEEAYTNNSFIRSRIKISFVKSHLQ